MRIWYLVNMERLEITKDVWEAFCIFIIFSNGAKGGSRELPVSTIWSLYPLMALLLLRISHVTLTAVGL